MQVRRERLIASRQRAGMLKIDLARAVGVSHVTILSVEKGTRGLSERTAKKIADVLGVPIDEIVVIDDTEAVEASA